MKQLLFKGWNKGKWGQGGAAAWDPTELTGMAMLLDPQSQLSGNDGDAISTVTEQYGNVFAQATGSKQPALKKGANGINGQNVIRFDGGDILVGSNFISSTEGTIFAVFKLNAQAGTPQVLLGSGDEGSTNRYVIFYAVDDHNGRTISAIQRNADPTTTMDGNTDMLADGTVYLAIWQSNGSAYRFRLNGLETLENTVVGTNNGDWFGDTANRDNITIGGLKYSIQEIQHCNLDLALLGISTTALDASEIALLESYIDTRFGLNWSGRGDTESAGYTEMPAYRVGMGREQPLIGGKIYATHGLINNPGPISFHSDCYEYDIATNTWATKTAASHARDGVGCWVYDGKLYVFGGRADSVTPVGLDFVEIYTPEPTDSWAAGTAIPTPVADPGVVGFDDAGTYKIFVIGGYTTDPNTHTAKIQLYYPGTDSWETGTPLTDMSFARVYPACIYYDEYVYVFGGEGGEAKSEKYNVATDTWTTLKDLPWSLQAGLSYQTGLLPALDSDNGVIHIFNGGEGGPLSHFVYDITNDAWIEMEPMITKRIGVPVVYSGGIIYMAGGAGNVSGSTWTKNIEAYRVSDGKWLVP